MDAEYFLNSSLFVLPFWLDRLDRFTTAIAPDSRWTPMDYDDERLAYLLPHASRLASNRTCMATYELDSHALPPLFLYQNTWGEKVTLNSIRMTCFETGVGFLEILVDYHEMELADICEFACNFKKSYKADKFIAEYMAEHGLVSAKEFAEELLQDKAELFFYTNADFKKEFFTFNMIRVEPGTLKPEEIDYWVYMLAHSYNTRSMNYEARKDSTVFDMTFQPFTDDFWGGCVEGMVNLTVDNGSWYTVNVKKKQLNSAYRLLYLLLLNQRLASIHYVQSIAEAASGDQKAITNINERIIRLKAAYSFRVVSNDMVYQTVYSKMYNILSIDDLNYDISQNEQQVTQLLQKKEAEKSERLNKLLVILSLLSISSFLIDANDYLELFFGHGAGVKLAPLVLLAVVLVYFFSKLYYKNDK